MPGLTIALQWMPGVRFCSHSVVVGPAPLSAAVRLLPEYMRHFEIFTDVVRGCQDLPTDVRTHAHEARGVGQTCFDGSYIEFLDTQIRLSPRGPEWTEILRRR